MVYTYKELKREILGHINQYSKAGTEVASSYNDQQDYLNRIPQLLNTALVSIRTARDGKPLIKSVTYPEATQTENATPPTEIGGFVLYTLPDDFWSLKTGSVARVIGGHFIKTNEFRMQGRHHIMLPKDGTFYIEYYAYPVQVPLNIQDAATIEEDPDVIQTATFYVAANLVMYEDEFMYSALYNEYESHLSRLSNGLEMEVGNVRDVYLFAYDWGWEL